MIILRGERHCVETLAFSPCGRRLAFPSYKGVQLWEDVVARGEPTLLPNLDYVHITRFTPDGRKLLIIGMRVFTYDLATKEATPFDPELNTWAYADLTPDGESVTFAQNETGVAASGRIFCRPLANPSRSTWSFVTHRSVLCAPLFLPDGRRFVVFEAAGARPSVVYVTRDAQTTATVAEVTSPGSRFFLPVLSADRRLIAARTGNRIAVFRSENFSVPPGIIVNDSRKEFTGVAFHPSGRFLAATSNDKTVKLYDTSTWQMAHAFDWDIGRLRSITFSPDGMLAAAGGDKGKIVVWDFDL